MTSAPPTSTPDRASSRSAPSADPAGAWRQALTYGLAGLWLLDGALQFQPFMFTAAFPKDVILPTAGGPSWVSAPVAWTAHLLEHHVTPLNALFATTQVALAVGIALPRTRRIALAGSVVWSLLVWWLAEGLGGIFAGPVMPIMGLPGAVLIYALVAILIWPPRDTGLRSSPRLGESVATSGPAGAAFAVPTWVALWVLFAWEQLRPQDRTSAAQHDMVASMASGEPRWVASINTWTATQLGHYGSTISIVLTLLFVLLGVSVFFPRLARPVLAAGIAVCLLFWLTAEDLGTIPTGRGTDPNSGLPLVLLLLCYWPVTTYRARISARSALGLSICLVAFAAAVGLGASAHSSATATSASGTPGGAGSTAPAAAPTLLTDHGTVGDITIDGAYIPQPASADVAAAYLTIINNGSTPDSIMSLVSNVTATVVPMTESDTGGVGTMTDLGTVTIPAHGTFTFTPGHAHLMLQNPRVVLAVGDTVAVTITFAHAGAINLDLPINPLAATAGSSAPASPTTAHMPGRG